MDNHTNINLTNTHNISVHQYMREYNFRESQLQEYFGRRAIFEHNSRAFDLAAQAEHSNHGNIAVDEQITVTNKD